jgi:hypothetical protein
MNKEQWEAWARDYPITAEHLAAFAALARSMPKPNEADWSENPYIYKPGMKTEPVQPQPIHICTGNRPEDGVGEALRRFIHTKPTMPGMVEHMDALVTFWDGQLDDMSGGFHLLRDRLVNAEDHATLKLMDELLHRVIEVRCQLDTMKKEQN